MYRLHKNENPWGPAPKAIAAIQEQMTHMDVMAKKITMNLYGAL
jgi:histidinol-phosphate/aromatic aminotransferase/cobyric acid decarboxylase-like protein